MGIVMNESEKKQQARKDRLAALAIKSRNTANEKVQRSLGAVSGIPPGQPILVDHHSAGKHRGALRRSDSLMRAGIDADAKADYYENKANAVGTGGISSDDPDAISKLREQLAQCKANQELMKNANAVLRKHSAKEDQLSGLIELGISQDNAYLIINPSLSPRVGFARYQLSNNGANMRRIEKRIQQLEKASGRENTIIKRATFEYREDKEENRVMFIFEGKPEKHIREMLSRNAFKWSPTRGAWVRMLTNAGIYAAKGVIAVLEQEATQPEPTPEKNT
jgi:hypothetical protein